MRVSFFAAGEEEEEEVEVVPLESSLGYDVAPYRFYLFKSYPPSLSTSAPQPPRVPPLLAAVASCGNLISARRLAARVDR